MGRGGEGLDQGTRNTNNTIKRSTTPKTLNVFGGRLSSGTEIGEGGNHGETYGVE